MRRHALVGGPVLVVGPSPRVTRRPVGLAADGRLLARVQFRAAAHAARRSQPMSGDAVFNVWKRLAESAGLPKGERLGWHSLRRKFATELRNTNLRDLCDLGGWKSIQTVLSCYVRPDEDSQRKALTERPTLRKAAIS